VKRSNRLVILVGVLLAVLAFVGIVVLLGQQKQPAAEKQTVNVLVAKQDIAIGDSVTPALVEVKEVEPAAVVGTRIADPSQLTGAPALFPVGAGSQVSAEALGGGSGKNICITCQLEAGEKAVAFQVERVTGLDFLIQPGDHIDILYRASVPVVQQTTDSTATTPRFEPIPGLENALSVKTLLQNKRVLYVSATKIKPISDPSATPVPGGTAAKAAETIETVVIVFAGTDADAESIKFAQNDQSVIGPLTAVLRNSEDEVVEDTTGITLKILIEQFGIPLPDLIQVELPPTTPSTP
jgi:Flp pilus assembly protein CpaB